MDKPRKRIENLLNKLNDEDRSTLACLLIKAGYAVKLVKMFQKERKQPNITLNTGRNNNADQQQK